MYITDDPTVKQNILRYAQRGTTSDEIYWLRSNGAQSPSTRFFFYFLFFIIIIFMQKNFVIFYNIRFKILFILKIIK